MAGNSDAGGSSISRRQRPVLIYAGLCRFCRWAARVVARIDRSDELALVRLDDEEAGSLLAAIPEEERRKSWWLVLRDGALVPGHRGGSVALLAEIRLTRTLGRLLRPELLSLLVDLFEAIVARYRGRLGLVVPDGPAPRRYP